jgi:glutathione synthase/RimK-type ligase-like ATP-grasp enzyme
MGLVDALAQSNSRSGSTQLKHVAFATSAAWPELTPDDRLAVEPCRARGIRVSPAVWSDPRVAWSDFDAVVVRSTWDYHRRFAEFEQWIGMLERTRCTVWNPCGLIRWNANKRYLADLERRGVPIVPTVWVRGGSDVAVRDVMERRAWDDIVVKPAISATAWGTRRIRRGDPAVIPSASIVLTVDQEVLVQPFVREIDMAGEWSLMFFGGTFSHSVRKRPVAGDFRVQTEFGGSAVSERAPASVIAAAERVVAAVTGPWLYARVDGVETADGFLLMELEMLEPLLFLELVANAPARFADAIAAAIDSRGASP